MHTTTAPKTSTRYLGYCPACDGDFKVRDGVLVHHGYQRPGYGHIVGDCFAVHMAPHETSPETAKKFLQHLQAIEASLVTRVEHLKTTDTLLVEKTKYEGGKYVEYTVTLKKGEVEEYEWDRTQTRQIDRVQSALRVLRSDIERVQNLVDTWVEKPLRTVEEEVAAKRAVVEARRAEKEAERRAKVQARIEGFQKRIDSAVRRKNATALANIWEKVNGDLANELKMTKAEVFKAIDRDSVWYLFGLVPGGNWRQPDDVENSNRAILQKMYGYFQKTKFWPGE